MPAQLRFGSTTTVSLDLASDALVAQCGLPALAPLASPRRILGESLRAPLDYPPLAQCVTPADRVVLALEPGLPQVESLVAEVAAALLQAGLDADGLTILRTADDPASQEVLRELPESVRDRVTLVTHDPGDRAKLAYLAATHEGTQILLNRVLTDADVVLPLARLRNPALPGYFGFPGAVYPTFSDAQTQLRFRAAPATETPASHATRLQAECDEVGWLLGLMFAIQVLPGPGDSILDVLAGETSAVVAQGRQRYEEAWRSTVPRRAALVVAAIEGGAAEQTWANVGIALDLARSLVEEGGAIAVCSELADAPGPGVQRLMGARSRSHVVRELRKERPNDVLPATQLAQALDHGDVYLLSRLDPTLVEELEMAPIAGPDELVRLTQRYPSCILVSNAPQAMVSVQKRSS